MKYTPALLYVSVACLVATSAIFTSAVFTSAPALAGHSQRAEQVCERASRLSTPGQFLEFWVQHPLFVASCLSASAWHGTLFPPANKGADPNSPKPGRPTPAKAKGPNAGPPYDGPTDGDGTPVGGPPFGNYDPLGGDLNPGLPGGPPGDVLN